MKENQLSQAEVIRLAKARGAHIGRPASPLPSNFHEVVKLYLDREITSGETRKILNRTSGNFYRDIRILTFTENSRHYIPSNTPFPIKYKSSFFTLLLRGHFPKNISHHFKNKLMRNNYITLAL